MKFSNQFFIVFFTDFCMINSTANLTATQLQTFYPTIYQNSMGSYQYTHQPLLLSLPPVISVVLVGCAKNRFVLCRHGEEIPLDMTAFLSTQIQGMCTLDVAQVWSFFSFVSWGITYPCALVHWFSWVGDEADEDMGMWVVEPDVETGSPFAGIIHMDSILRAAHLMGVCREVFVPKKLTPDNSLYFFYSFYVNKFVDHHAFKIAFWLVTDSP